MDGDKLKTIAELFGGVTELARAVKLPPSSIVRRISGHIPIKERDKHAINLTIDDRVRRLQEAKWDSCSN